MDALHAIVNSQTSPVGILTNLLVTFYALKCIPSLPSQLAWITSNFVTQTFLVGLLVYRANVVGDQLQLAFLIAAVAIAALNVANGQPALGQLNFGGLKLPF